MQKNGRAEGKYHIHFKCIVQSVGLIGQVQNESTKCCITFTPSVHMKGTQSNMKSNAFTLNDVVIEEYQRIYMYWKYLHYHYSTSNENI